LRFALRIALPLGALSLAATLSAQQATFDAASIKRKTGLTGTYDYELTMPVPALAPNPASPPGDSGILTRMREQLGLKLESRRDDAPVIVIDQAERPSLD